MSELVNVNHYRVPCWKPGLCNHLTIAYYLLLVLWFYNLHIQGEREVVSSVAHQGWKRELYLKSYGKIFVWSVYVNLDNFVLCRCLHFLFSSYFFIDLLKIVLDFFLVS